MSNRIRKEVNSSDKRALERLYRSPSVWLGSLPPQTPTLTLVYHICSLTEGLQSLFLITQSHCAFLNYESEQQCRDAQQKLDDSVFQEHVLCARFRSPLLDGLLLEDHECSEDEKNKTASPIPIKPLYRYDDLNTFAQDRYFILKSRSQADIKAIISAGCWATQFHNEEKLNLAFKNSGNVYLIFSVNKSGEFFGYARMSGSIINNSSYHQNAGYSMSTTDSEALRAPPNLIPIRANGPVPKGVLRDDGSPRFVTWEAENARTNNVQNHHPLLGSSGFEAMIKGYRRYFPITWATTTPLSFRYTNHLVNIWNRNRLVKVARDGTQVDPATGSQLLSLLRDCEYSRYHAHSYYYRNYHYQ